MQVRIDYDTLTRMLLAVAERIRAAEQRLSTLDAATGDGDHGAAMRKVADAVTHTIDGRANKDMAGLLTELGWAAMGTDAGSTGPLYGSLLVGMSEKVGDGEPLEALAFTDMLDCGVANLRMNTKAKPGDKTMLDALVPAVEAIRAAAEAGGSLGEVLEAGASAAAAGAEATVQMQAAHGRARNIGERSIGHMDPGAASMALVFAGLMEGYKNG